MKLAAAAIIGCILCAVLKQNAPVYAYLLAITLCVGMMLAAGALLSPLLRFLERLQQMTGLASALLTPVYKVIAIGALTQIAGGFCEDAGEQALGKIVSLCAMVLALYAAQPLFDAALELLQTMLGGGA